MSEQTKPIGPEQVREAAQVLLRYKRGRAKLEARLTENEDWYRLRHWERGPESGEEVRPASAWLFNCIANKHADAMENFPEPTVLPREEGDAAEAKALSAILPVVLDLNDFEETWSAVLHDKLKSGTGVYGVFWDPEKLGGLGDVTVARVPLLSLYWQPGTADIQRSPHLFHVERADRETLVSRWPALADAPDDALPGAAEAVHEDGADGERRLTVIDWYYRRRVGGREVLHYCKFCGDTVLFASENDPRYKERGWYDHGQYPFVFDRLFPAEGSPAGFGYLDVGKGAQTYIDRCDRAILKNTLANAAPRFFANAAGSVNEREFADLSADFVHVDGQLAADSIRPIEGKPLAGIYYRVLQGKIDELKETTGNRDVLNGGVSSGATAASAIAAMQEAGGKLSRDHTRASYRAYRRMILLVIELIRQFYTLPRRFRILGEDGETAFVTYSNEGLLPRRTERDFVPEPLSSLTRTPLFDVQVSAQRASPYSKLSRNELALSFYRAGMFAPENAAAAATCFEMMDFDRRDALLRRVKAAAARAQAPAAPAGGFSGAEAPPLSEPDGFGGARRREAAIVKNARVRAAKSVAVE